ncbi:protein chromatin remodeling 19 [Tanacetum coccineum]
MVNGLERQTSDEKLVLLDDDGKSLKKVNYLVNADSDSEAEEVFDETACFMASTSYKSTASTLEEVGKADKQKQKNLTPFPSLHPTLKNQNHFEMKRGFDSIEISDDEWSNHDFNSSRILNNNNNNTSKTLPSIESFAFTKPSPSHSPSSSSDCVQIITENPENLEDDDFAEAPSTSAANRGRRFVIDDEEDEAEEDAIDLDEYESDDYELGFVGEEKEEDVVGKALFKCSKISAELRKDLYGSNVASDACDRYAEVDGSSVRIVTQDDICEACQVANSGFKPMLKPYQLVGVNFLMLLYRKKVAGAILADEMGLGKTIQAITYLTLLSHLEDDPGPHLIVCPASVLENWERELKKWCPSFTVLQYHGAARATHSKMLNSMSKSRMPPPFNVILVCYSLFERHSAQQKDDRKVLKRWKWSCVLMDEAHALKDKSSYRWKNLMSVARNANQRLMLTGTPLQNDLHELWSLLEFMMPDLFETEDVDLKKLLNAEDTELIARMKSILGPFILRRLKSDVMQQLVPKVQRVEYVLMETEQREAYQESIEEYRAFANARMLKSGQVNNSSLPKRQISNYFVQFRKIANHPLLVRHIYTDKDVVRFAKMLHPKGVFGDECTVDRVIEELKSYNDFSIHRLLLYYGNSTSENLSDDHVMISAKCRALAGLLPTLVHGGHRVLIFSQWTSMLDILEWALDVIGITYRRLDGRLKRAYVNLEKLIGPYISDYDFKILCVSLHLSKRLVLSNIAVAYSIAHGMVTSIHATYSFVTFSITERQTIVDTFNNDTSINACLLSTRAGGQGLNLTGADTVIIHDMDFNPQIDRQAEDRCHRIGQTKPVTIYRVVTKDTVDQNMHEIAKSKLVVDAAMLESGIEVENEGELSDNKTMGEILSIRNGIKLSISKLDWVFASFTELTEARINGLVAINSYRARVVTNGDGTSVPISTVFSRLRDMLTRNGGSNFAPHTGESSICRPPPVTTHSPHMFFESLGLTGSGVTNSSDGRVVTRADRTTVPISTIFGRFKDMPVSSAEADFMAHTDADLRGCTRRGSYVPINNRSHSFGMSHVV